MLLTRETLKGIEAGAVTLAFRRWRRPTVKAGGTLLTAIGQLAVEAVDVVSLDEITEAEATAAGFPTVAALRSRLLEREEGRVYRVRLSLAGPDPRIALREAIPAGEEMERLLGRLHRLDQRAAGGPWTGRVLRVLAKRPACRAGDLAAELGVERDDFKARVRKLKGLGLTESLRVGYRLSPRGQAVLALLEGPAG